MGARESYIKEGFNDYLSKPIMYEDLENLLIRYIDPALVESGDAAGADAADTSGSAAGDPASAPGSKSTVDKPLVLVINESAEKLNDLKEVISSKYKGVYVKTEADAQKFLAKHHVEFIIRDGQ